MSGCERLGNNMPIEKRPFRLNDEEFYLVDFNRERNDTQNSFTLIIRNVNLQYKARTGFPATLENQVRSLDFKWNKMIGNKASGKQLNEFFKSVGI